MNVAYELVEAGDVQPSHLPLHGFQKNPNYTLENERRYHDEPAGRDKVNENASKLDPELLLDAPDANQGAPVVDREGNVLGGNGRAMSIQKAYESFPERGNAYRAALETHVERLGLDPTTVSSMKKPMLIRRLENDPSRAERQKLVSALNEDFTHSREKRSDSKSRGDRLSQRTLGALADGLRDADSLRAYFDTQGSSHLVNMLVSDGVIQNTEKTAYVGADGLLNPDGKTLVEAALRGRIARSYETLAKLPADIVGKLDAAIPHILIAEHVGGQWNITEHVREAVDMLAGFAKSGQKHADVYLRQVDMITGKAPIETASLQAQDIFNRALSMKKGEFASAFAKYTLDAKRSPEAGGMIAKDAQGSFTEALGTEPSAKNAPAPETKSPEQKAPSKDESSNVDAKPEDKGIALKLGETIGGSRADTAEATGKRKAKQESAEEGDKVPAWRKPFIAMQGRDGKWAIAKKVPGKSVVRPVSRDSFDTEAEAEKAIPLAAVNLKHRVRTDKDGQFAIVRYVTDRKRVTIKDGFASPEEAKRHMIEHAVEILETKTGHGEEILPVPEFAKREGPERRKGDVTPDAFMKDFGFRGAEFGKWNNQGERQMLLNQAYDALMDLADILDVPPRALSLNGEIAIAFGARGQGLTGARAHYESDYAVFNLTKVDGAGSMAHEWMHALDNYFARQDGKIPSEKVKNKRGDMVYSDVTDPSKRMASHGFSRTGSGVREEVRGRISEPGTNDAHQGRAVC